MHEYDTHVMDTMTDFLVPIIYQTNIHRSFHNK